MTRREAIKHNWWQFLVSADQATHCLGGFISSILVSIFSKDVPIVWADETLSSRCWRWRIDGARKWPCYIIDILFWWDRDKETGKKHCQLSYENEQDRLQLPPELRK